MQKVSFDLTAEYIELNQLLKVVGLCDSGGAGKQIVASGEVYVDGKQELRKTCKIRAGQQVRLGDVLITVIGEGGADGA
ncbi:MAG TPA: RNA-binding S4 domain-containing protein [Pseudoduganella sp.]|jgi:ribosome-associated protein|uniref:RNA-binding S4 domain-containing protein n=1 Tax=Pseudoduganella sp. UC29_106 TaxID=3374553 RepID=UPI002EF6C853